MACSWCDSDVHENCYNRVVVSKHKHFRQLLLNKGFVNEDAPSYRVIDDITQIRDRHVFGILPLHLAHAASLITEIPLFLPHHLRSIELTLSQLKRYSKRPITYIVRQAPDNLRLVKLK